MQAFISEVHPYDATDKQMLENMFQEMIELPEPEENVEVAVETVKEVRRIVIYDYSGVYEMDDIAEWYMEEEYCETV